jgi:hypothetical protein
MWQGMISFPVMLLLLLSNQGTNQEPQSVQVSKVSIQIRGERSRVLIGDPITLNVTLSNDGPKTLFIGRNLPGVESDAAYVSFTVSDNEGHQPQGWASAGDRFTPNAESFANAIMENWVAISPGFSYSFRIDVRPFASVFLGKKGIYKFKAIYNSRGIGAQIANQHLVAGDDDVSRLPFEAWIGTTESNEVSIQVVPSGAK